MTIDEAIKHSLEVAEQNEQGLYDAIALGGQNPTQEEIANCEQCVANHRQLTEWLTELKEAKRLLKSARSIIEDVICNKDYLCNECEYRAKCDGGFSFYWRYTDKALKLIGDDDTNG